MSIYDPISEALGLDPIDFDYEPMPKAISLSEAYIGELNSFYGKTHTEELKYHWSQTRQGKNNGMYGRSVVAEKNLRWYNNGKENIYVTEGTQPKRYVPGRCNLKRKPHSKETKQRISNSMKGNTSNKTRQRSVLSPRGKLYPSIKEAAKSCGLTISQFRYRKIKNGNWVIQ